MTRHNQCGLEGFFFSGIDPKRFTYPQLQWPLLPYSFVIYRVALALYQVATFVSALMFWGVPPFYDDVDTKMKWFIYISNWSYMVATAYIVWAGVTTLYWHTRGEARHDPGNFYFEWDKNDDVVRTRRSLSRKERETVTVKGAYVGRMTWYFKLSWFLQGVACSSQLGVTLIYWALGADLGNLNMNFFTVNVHLISFLIVVVDFLISAVPTRVFHLTYSVIFGLAYFLFIYFYQCMMDGLGVNGKSFIYEDYLDWNEHPMMSYIVSVTVVVVLWPLFHIFFFILYLVKRAFSRCYCAGTRFQRKFADEGEITAKASVTTEK